MEKILTDYGWGAVLLLFMVDMVFPAWRDWFFPARKREQEARITAEEEDRHAREEERKFRHEMDLRSIATTEQLAKAVAQQVEISAATQRSIEFVTNAIGDMKQTVAVFHPEVLRKNNNRKRQ